MGRGKTLTDYEKGCINAYAEDGKRVSWIAKKLKRSFYVIKSYLNNPTFYGSKKSPGRPSKVTKHDRRRILAIASNSTKSTKEILEESGVNVHRETIRRVINASPNIVRSKMNTNPALKPHHITARLEFARKNMATNWKHVSF